MLHFRAALVCCQAARGTNGAGMTIKYAYSSLDVIGNNYKSRLLRLARTANCWQTWLTNSSQVVITALLARLLD